MMILKYMPTQPYFSRQYGDLRVQSINQSIFIVPQNKTNITDWSMKREIEMNARRYNNSASGRHVIIVISAIAAIK